MTVSQQFGRWLTDDLAYSCLLEKHMLRHGAVVDQPCFCSGVGRECWLAARRLRNNVAFNLRRQLRGVYWTGLLNHRVVLEALSVCSIQGCRFSPGLASGNKPASFT